MGTGRLERAAMVVALIALHGAALGQTLNESSGPWVLERSGTTAGLRGIHAVGGGVAWASGTDGTVLRTEDGGYEWQSCTVPPDAATLDFRGIWAWDANTAIVMSSGPGDQSRLYKTTDGCSSWKLLFTNPDQDGFWDAMAFADRGDGMILGDPTMDQPNKPGRHPNLLMTILTSSDGGTTWLREFFPRDARLGVDGLQVEKGTGAFAASNSALFLVGHRAWFGTGGTPGARVFIGDAYGAFSPVGTCGCVVAPPPPDRIWFPRRTAVPLQGDTDSAGVFSLDWKTNGIPGDKGILMAVGGDYSKPNDSAGTAAWSADGGKTWTAAAKPPHGYRSAVAWDADAKAWIAVGTNGSDISYDDGKTWVPLDDGDWNALSLPWVVGPSGRIAKLDPGKLPKPNPK